MDTVTTPPAQQIESVSGSNLLLNLVLLCVALLSRLAAENRQLHQRVAELEAALRLERDKRFGASSERSDPLAATNRPPQVIAGEVRECLPGETAASAEAPTETAPAAETPAAETRPRRQRGGQPGHRGVGRQLPPDLPRQEQWVELPEDERCCPQCGEPYGDSHLTEDSEEIEVEVKAYVRRYRRKRYRRQCHCPGPRFITAPPPAKLIPKGKFGVATWVKFLLDKYQAQLPITRQLKQLEQVGLTVAKSTLSGGFKKLADYLLPLYEQLLTRLRTARHLHADETRWRVVEAVPGKASQRWWLWLFASVEVRVVVFVLDPGRSANVPKKYLAERLPAGQTEAPGHEVNQIDGQAYALSDQLAIISADRLRVYQAISQLVQVAFCWSHQRRDFVDFRKAHAHQPELVAWADSWLTDIGHLYSLNHRRLACPQQPDAFATAQAALEQAVAAMRARADDLDGLTPAQEKLLRSLQRHWAGLTLFVTMPDLPMDNNWAERLLRTPVLGRKNYYGHQTLWAGELAAMLFSIIETCHLNGLNPFDFLVAYFQACAELGAPPTDLTPFCPWLQRDHPPP